MNPRRVNRAGARPSYTRRPTPTARQRARARRQPAWSGRTSGARGGGGFGLNLRLPALPNLSLQLPTIRVRWLRLALAAVPVIVILILLGRATRLEHVRIEGNHTLTTAHIDQLAQAGLHQQWFGHTTILIDGNALITYMENAEPGIKAAATHRSSLHTLTIVIEERQPTLNWKTNGSVYLLDADATVIGPTKGAYAALPTVTDSSNLPVKVGDRVAPTQFVSFCSQLAQLLPPAGYQISAMTVPASTSEVYVTTSTGLLLKFDTTRPAGDEVADLKQVQAELAAAKKTPTQYIDLRIPHKAYYK